MMKSQQASDQNKIDLFWDRYIRAVNNQGIASPFDRWHVIRAEQYIKFFEHKLRAHIVTDLEVYLSELGRNTALKDWQIRQAVDAIRILLCDVAGHSWACEFDWDGWIDSVKQLPNSHPTVARDYDQSIQPAMTYLIVLPIRQRH